MISFRNDYCEFAHKKILNKMVELADNQYVGYGLDEISARAKERIKALFSREADIHFLVGGTQTNKTVIDHILRPYQAVIACESGHINVHETGAIEATGHKVLTCKAVNGKVTPEGIREIVLAHPDCHMVMPKMVYVSNSTEIGTTYTKAELEAISSLCKELGLYLFLDGARLAVGLTAQGNDLTINDIANLCDVFYIGGTKNGALLGEAVVILNDELKPNFDYITKQNGGLLAKGFLAGLQFDELFTDNLYFELGRHANEMASILKEGVQELGFELEFNSNTNQQFVNFNKNMVQYLSKEFDFEIWGERDDVITVRFVTSFNTSKKNVQYLLDYLKKAL